ncbi:hypothetical protein ACFFMN_42600 [Planobispora siamensis]|uniref:hypothetical protein n=1 Tax=Planobispora siamensis TaxID=936338 RepID=UPI00194DEB4F|nr:hypothetical protein [Planobispora siamensis]
MRVSSARSSTRTLSTVSCSLGRAATLICPASTDRATAAFTAESRSHVSVYRIPSSG